MQKVTNDLKSAIARLYHSFTPASRAVILFTLPFALLDAIHYYTAGTGLLVTLPLLLVAYLACGSLAARIAAREGQEMSAFPRIGASAGIKLWLASTLINTLVSLLLGFATLGGTLLSTAVYLCLFAPLHALGSVLIGWLGGGLYRRVYIRTRVA
jgi:hypothetical protein